MKFVPGELSNPEKEAAKNIDPKYREEKISRLEKGAVLLVSHGDKMVDMVRGMLEANQWELNFISDKDAQTFVTGTPYEFEPEMAHAIVRVLLREHRKEHAH